MRITRNLNLYFVMVVFFIIYSMSLLFLAKNSVTWEDEMFTLHTTSNDLCFAIKESYNFEGQPPVYFGLLNIWRNVSKSLFFARLFSLVFTLLTGIMIFKICRIFFDKEVSTITTTLFLLNPFVIEMSFEARLYALIMFLSSSSIYLYYEAYLKENPKKINIVFHTVVSLLGAFTQYLFVFLLLGQSIILLQKKRWQKFLIFFVIHLVIALIFTINFIFISKQVEYHKSLVEIDLDYIKNFFASIQNFLFSFNLFKFNTILERGIIIIYLLWLLVAFKRLNFSFRAAYKTIAPVYPLFIIAIVIFLFVMLSFIIANLNFTSRYLTILYPALFLFFIFSLTISGRKHFLIWCTFLSIYYLSADIKAYSTLVHNLDYERAAEFIENNIDSDAPLLFYKRTNAIPFQYYYHGSNKIVQLPTAYEYNTVSGQNHYIKDTVILHKIFNVDLKTEKELFLLTDNSGIVYHRSLNYGMIDQYLSLNFYTILDTLIMGRAKASGFRVRKLVRKDPF
jgi:hypothetical protein